ncbi:hypothetical protein B14911_10487 [Bacillus sp. NRRL B-14911]|uniref:hypothetical protein n=1 Tax=Bacillus sp. NRRL B-14911 TaxID=313627 RepID=UPI00006B594F|nr:hypothetical protein [Bacillus sp. NRRL B-14911]EAR66155.1 hypothetical protein B14911_10487 [Bacillus sp. NRRL B-14911]
METREDLYMLQATLNNLALLKIAYDSGLDMQNFTHYVVSYDFSFDPIWGNFSIAIQELAEEYEYYPPDSEEVEQEKKYWIDLAGASNTYLDSVSVLVILDDRIEPFELWSIGGYSMGTWYSGFGEIYPIDRGMVLIIDEEEGPIDYTNALSLIVERLNLEKGRV